MKHRPRIFVAALTLALGVAMAAGAQAAERRAAGPAAGTLTVEQLRAKYQRHEDHLIDIGGVQVRYRDEGSGQAILLLHGSRSTLETYDGIVAKLKDRFRLIRFDMPPMGLSGPISDAATATLPTPESLLTGLLDRLHVPSVIAVGVSSGGTMAYYLAGSSPQRVVALVLANTPADPVDNAAPKLSPEFKRLQQEAAATGSYTPEYWRGYLTWLYGEPSRITPAEVERFYDMNRRVPEAHPMHLLALTANNATTLDRLSKVTAPTLIVWGMRDPVLTYPAAIALRDHLTATHASLLLLDDVGHYPTLEVPERVAAIIETFVRDVHPLPPLRRRSGEIGP